MGRVVASRGSRVENNGAACPSRCKHYGRQKLVLNLENSLREQLGCVTRQDGNPCLCQRGSMVVGFVHQVNGRAGLVDSTCKHSFMDSASIHALSPKGRQQGRVDVNDSSPIRRDDVRGDELDVSSEYYEIHAISSQECEPDCAVSGAGQHLGGKPPGTRPFESSCFGSITDNEYDLCCGLDVQSLVQRLQIAAASRNRHGDSHGHGRGS